MLRKRYRKEQFLPTLPLGLFLNPFFFGRRAIVRFIRQYTSLFKGDVIDVGCGSKPYKELFTVTKYLGVDIENPGHSHLKEEIDVFYDGVKLPFEDLTFDHALCFEVLEHVPDPGSFLKEVARVVKPEGYLMLTTPFVWSEHEVPFDFARYSQFGLVKILESSGWNLVSHQKLVKGNILFILLRQMTLLNYIEDLKEQYGANSSLVMCARCILFPIMAVLNLLGYMLQILPASGKFYFNNALIAVRK